MWGKEGGVFSMVVCACKMLDMANSFGFDLPFFWNWDWRFMWIFGLKYTSNWIPRDS